MNQISLWQRTGERLDRRRRTLGVGERICSTGDPIEHLVFPLAGVVVQARNAPHDALPLASGITGNEGYVGWGALLGAAVWQHDVIAVIAGDAVEVPMPAVSAEMERDPALRALLLRYLFNVTLQLSQNTVANLGHSLERRLARWLTMFHDRVAGDELRLTHDMLAMLLNVRRASVTDALHILEGERLVRGSRGRITIRDRVGLQAAAAYSYGYAEDDYNAAIGPFGKGSGPQQAEQQPAG